MSPGEPPEGELARFFGYSHDLLVILDEAGRVLMVSPSVERILGHSLEAMLGASLLDFVHEQDRDNARLQTGLVREGRRVPDLDLRVRQADGTWVPLRCSLAAGPHGRIYGVGRDKTVEVRHRKALVDREVADLRLRTAMELHDGILQTLTGASFQIAIARRLLHADPTAAEQVLATLARSVSAEQQEMRLYVDEVKGREPSWADERVAIGTRVEEMLERVALVWGVEIDADLDLPDGLTADRDRELMRIIQEAAVNAARHGGAHRVSVTAHSDGGGIHVVVEDDGHGFSFLGEYDDAELRRRRLGPLSLKRRVASAGGSLSIRSTREGSALSVRLPIPEGRSG